MSMRLSLLARPFSLCWRPSYATLKCSPFSVVLFGSTLSRWQVFFGPHVLGGIYFGPFILVVGIVMQEHPLSMSNLVSTKNISFQFSSCSVLCAVSVFLPLRLGGGFLFIANYIFGF